jgi:DNA-binding CsgD family transcriptional regulator
MTADHDELIQRMVGRGSTSRQIAEHLGVSTRVVQRRRVALGIAESGGRRFTAEEHARIMDMIEDGCPIPEIARTIGRNPHVVLVTYRGMSTAKPLGSRAYTLRKQLGLA